MITLLKFSFVRLAWAATWHDATQFTRAPPGLQGFPKPESLVHCGP